MMRSQARIAARSSSSYGLVGFGVGFGFGGRLGKLTRYVRMYSRWMQALQDPQVHFSGRAP